MINRVRNYFLRKLLNDRSEDAGVGTRNDSTRERWVIETLRKIPAKSKLLDAGAGECRFRENCSHLEYVSQDFNQYEGTGDHKGLQTNIWDTSAIDIVSDITEIPVAAGSFDAVLCTEVLEHVPDPVAAVKELARVLRPGGTLIITAPFNSLTHFSPYHFATGFNRYFYEHWMKTLNFEIVELVANGNYFEYMAQETRRLKSIAKKYADDSDAAKMNGLRQLTINALGTLARQDHGSSELLCYGYHLLARKES